MVEEAIALGLRSRRHGSRSQDSQQRFAKAEAHGLST